MQQELQTLLVVGGQSCVLNNDNHFSAVRAALGYEPWLAKAVANFDWVRMAAGGGKGGDKMARTACRRLFVKEVSGGDEATLCNLEFLEAYVARVSTLRSLIVHIVAHLTRPDGQTCIIMNNWLPARSPAANLLHPRAHPSTQPNNVSFHRLYDLKGTADDKLLMVDGSHVPEVHKRFYNLSWLVGEAVCGASSMLTPTARHTYAQGKEEAFHATFSLSPEQRDGLLSSLRDDAAFLASPAAAGGLMDYSIILGVARYGAAEEAAGIAGLEEPRETLPDAPAWVHARPLCVRSGGYLYVYYIGIIDFLQQWTTGKMVAHFIKECCAPHPISTVPPPVYARQFVAHFEHAFVADGVAVERAPAA